MQLLHSSIEPVAIVQLQHLTIFVSTNDEHEANTMAYYNDISQRSDLVERLLGNHVRRARAKGISNGAVMVVDNQTAEVLAYCGSADFFDEDAAGQVDGVLAIRSPGSTLKLRQLLGL